jgi:copper chaperone
MKKTLEISGMSCGHCVHAVREALSSLPSVRIEDVVIGKAVIVSDPPTTDDDIRTVVEEEGYTLTAIR